MGATHRRAALCLAIGIGFGCGPAHATVLDIDKVETKDLELLYFDPIETYLTPHVGRSFENSLEFQKRTFDWKPWDRPAVFLQDFSDYGNAAVRSSPNNALYVEIEPMNQAFETFSSGERFYTLFNHELVHMATMDVWNDEDAFWRDVFQGKPLPISAHPESIAYNYLATPRVNVPRWYLEGSAVFFETWMAGGIGRAQGPYDEMVFRSMVRDNAHFFSPLGLESEGNTIDFQAGMNDYLYGPRFFSYLALTRSPEKVIEWLKRGPDSDRYYSTQFEKVFNEPLDGAWNDWINWENDFQRQNLKQVQQYPITPLHHLTSNGLGSVSRSYYDPKTNSLVGGFRYPGVLAHVGEISLDTGQVRRLVNIKGPVLFKVTSLTFDADARKIYFTTNNNGGYRGLMEVDADSGDSRMLIPEARIGELTMNPVDKSIWGVRHLVGLCTLVRVSKPYSDWNQVVTFPYGEVVSDIDISPDGKLISATVGEINGDEAVRVYKVQDFLDGKLTEVAHFDFGTALPENFVFSPDGRYLYGSSFYTGVSNIYRFEIATGKIEAVTNAVTGYFRPIPRPDGSLIVWEYTGQGYVPGTIVPKPLNDLGTITFLGKKLADERPIVRSWAVGSPAKVDFEDMITDKGKYVPLDELHLSAVYPVLEGYKAHPAGGVYVLFEDPLEFNQLAASIAYSPNAKTQSERLHFDIDYHDINWHLRYWHNMAGFYDLFGPTDNSRKGDGYIGGWNQTLIYDPPRQLDVKTELAYYTGLDTLPGAQNVKITDTNIVEQKASAVYTNTDRSLGAVDYEQGWRGNVEIKADEAKGGFFPKIHAGVDFGLALPWANSSIWLYNAAGIATGPHLDPLNDFYFGAFGNNYVDDGEVKRYRNYDSFPGFDIDEIGAREFAKTMLELNLPPIRYADVGTPGFYLSSTRTAIFGGLLAVDPGATTKATAEDVGLQVDWNFTVALRLPMTFSMGYAHGFADRFKGRDELMASLKIL